MRASSLSAFLLICGACSVSVPPPVVGVRVRAEVGIEARVPPPPPVALEGAAVVEFFGIPLDGAQDIVFVLDLSGSMSEPAQGRIAKIGAEGVVSEVPPKIEIARLELLDALERLPASTRMNVVFFNSGLEAFAPTLVALEVSDRESLLAFVREGIPVGRTALAPALRTAFLMQARRVVLLSDGLANLGGNARVVLRDAREAMRGELRIDTIGLGSYQDRALLHALATESGGLYQPL